MRVEEGKEGKTIKRKLKKEIKRYNVGSTTTITPNVSVNVLSALLSPPGLSFELRLIFLFRLPPLSFLRQLHSSLPSPSFLILAIPLLQTFLFFVLSVPFFAIDFMYCSSFSSYPSLFFLPVPPLPSSAKQDSHYLYER